MTTANLLKTMGPVANLGKNLLQRQREIECSMKRNILITPCKFIRNTTGYKQQQNYNMSRRILLAPSWKWQQFSATIVQNNCHFGTKNNPDCANKSDSKSAAITEEVDLFGNSSNLSLFKKFKLMYKQYWYVLIPVHVITSLGWMGGFYYMLKSGVDVAAIMSHLHISEAIVEKVRSSHLGHWAVAYLCFKVATPLRYAVTLGGTTAAIKYLVQSGLIKPMPSKKEIIRICEEKMVQPFADKEKQAASKRTDTKDKSK